MTKLLVVVSLASILLMTACEKKEILQGKREPIAGVTIVDSSSGSSISSAAKIIPGNPSSLNSYTDVAGNKQHLSINHSFTKTPKLLWKKSIGSGPINTDPIVFGDNIYAVNEKGILVCVSIKSGGIVWKKPVAKQPDDAVFSGGITADASTIYVTSNIGDVIAVDSKSQKEIWRKSLKYPLKGAPLYANGMLIVTSIENQTYALKAINGDTVWTQSTPREETMMAESATPAFFGNKVFCAYNSGDLKSIELNTGTESWDEVLFSSNVSESGAVISHIAASPVVFNGNVLAATSESKMVLIDTTSGIRIWENDIGTIQTPAVNADWVFVLANDDTVRCLSTKTGSTKWVFNLAETKGLDRYRGVSWTGPLVINGDVVVFNSVGNIVKLDISTGKMKSQEKIEGMNPTRTPIIVNGKMFTITSRANIYAIG